MAQFTAISGRNIPTNYKAMGKFFYNHLHQLRNGCNNRNEQNKTQITQI